MSLGWAKTNQALLHSFNFLGPYQKVLPELGLSLSLSQIVDTEPSQKNSDYAVGPGLTWVLTHH